ncbi:hypothetical protein CK203_030314 [Vitis vinifera]|uniref:Uncharacterized protein n=1 Tax=Vitis vinifera TaxID=29760 RepID=A0A438IVA6_VITVI|nr:hypothetical protein CK203_030314 [Vitis vinifera]
MKTLSYIPIRAKEGAFIEGSQLGEEEVRGWKSLICSLQMTLLFYAICLVSLSQFGVWGVGWAISSTLVWAFHWEPLYDLLGFGKWWRKIFRNFWRSDLKIRKDAKKFLLRGRDFGEKVAYGELIYSLDKSNEGLGIRNLSTFNKDVPLREAFLELFSIATTKDAWAIEKVGGVPLLYSLQFFGTIQVNFISWEAIWDRIITLDQLKRKGYGFQIGAICTKEKKKRLITSSFTA